MDQQDQHGSGTEPEVITDYPQRMKELGRENRESINAMYKAAVIYEDRPGRGFEGLLRETLTWVD